MPKTIAVETAVCDICGAEVRDGSQFCYNCGGAVSNGEEPEAIPPPVEPIVAHATDPDNGVATKVDYDPAKRRAERAERRRVRASNREPVEIVWEPREGVSWAFVAGSVIFAILALVIVIMAFYFR